MLRVDELTVRYGRLDVIRNFSFEAKAGRITAIVGSNGAGKSTILRAVCGFVPISAGTVKMEGKDIAGLPPYCIVEAGISIVDEAAKVFPYMTVEENLALGAYKKTAWPRRGRNMKSVYELFPRLEERRFQQARTLSGGERRMLVFGRGLMAEPKLLILDEPSSGLSPLIVMHMFEAVKRVSREGITILLVEQNVWESLSLGSHGYVIENGCLVLQGPCRELLENPDIKKAYLRI